VNDTELASLFKAHRGRLTAHLARALGLAHLALAEDAVQAATLKALALWPEQGWPANPVGWLYRVAHHHAIDALRAGERTRPLADGDDEGAPPPAAPAREERFAAELDDDELALLFAACHPVLPLPSQVLVALKALAGLSLKEIADGMLTTEAALAQRLARARSVLHDVPLGIPSPQALAPRREAVLAAIYLMFSTGYRVADAAPASPAMPGDAGEAAAARKALCWEAIRLARSVAAHPRTAHADADALAALLLFHGARLTGRVDEHGDIVLLADQPRDRWDAGMVRMGFAHLQRAQRAEALSRYHLQAGVAAEHAIAPSYAQTDWPRVLRYYELLLPVDPTPAPRLAHAIALSEAGRAAEAAQRLQALLPQVAAPLRAHALAAWAHALWRCGHADEARQRLREAIAAAPTAADARLLEQRLSRYA
jgi:RNA polymerase sigma-70 factor, ECF subfamily